MEYQAIKNLSWVESSDQGKFLSIKNLDPVTNGSTGLTRVVTPWTSDIMFLLSKYPLHCTNISCILLHAFLDCTLCNCCIGLLYNSFSSWLTANDTYLLRSVQSATSSLSYFPKCSVGLLPRKIPTLWHREYGWLYAEYCPLCCLCHGPP